MNRNRAVLASFVLLLVVLAFARAYLASSTGIVNVGDAADYEAMASTMALTTEIGRSAEQRTVCSTT